MNGGGADTVGSLLADVGTALSEALRMLMFADKRQWGPDEFEQVRALECALDEARKDFQEMGPLVNGQLYYENDRKAESLDELRHLRNKFDFHRDNFRDWLRTGGPINPVWARETALLQRELHRAQCRAAARIFAAGQDLAAGARCLGAFQVRREHRRIEADRRRRRRRRQLDGLPPWHQHQHQHQNLHHQNYDHSHNQNQYRYRQRQRQGVVDEEAARQEEQLGAGEAEAEAEVEAEEEESAAAAGRIPRRNSLEELAPCCNAIGKFERYRDRDVAFVCDFCDGFLVWENLESMPSTQQRPARGGGPGPAPSPSADYPHWQAVGRTVSGGEDDGVEPGQERRKAAAAGEEGGTGAAAAGGGGEGGEEKTIVFAPIAIANHVPPAPGDFEARILCPYCDEYTYIDQGDADEDELRYTQDEGGFPDVAAFQEHLEWSHTPIAVPAMRALPTAPGSCRIM